MWAIMRVAPQPHAGEMLTPLTMSVRHGLKLGKLLSTIHPYPTLSEANRFAAGRWRERHAPGRLLAILGRCGMPGGSAPRRGLEACSGFLCPGLVVATLAYIHALVCKTVNRFG